MKISDYPKFTEEEFLCCFFFQSEYLKYVVLLKKRLQVDLGDLVSL